MATHSPHLGLYGENAVDTNITVRLSLTADTPRLKLTWLLVVLLSF